MKPSLVASALLRATAFGLAVSAASCACPPPLTPGLIDQDLENTSLYELLRTRYGLDPARARETYFAVAADSATAALLGIAVGSPIFSVERVTSLDNGRPFEFVQSAMRGDRYSIVLDLSASHAPQTTREGATR